jgi:predicted aspartyl protease
MMDTGANINAIQKDLAQSLKLPVVLCKESFSTIESAGVGGSFEAGDIVMLGDCHLSNMPKEHDLLFIKNLTAASIDIGLAGVIAEGLLGTTFFECFSAVEFDWYGTDGDPPTFIFYYKDLPEYAKKNAFCVPLENDSFFNVPIVNVSINGIEVRALVDTGSCISIVSPQIAESAGLERLHKSVNVAEAGNATVTIFNVTFLDVDTLFIGELPGITASFAEKAIAEMPQALVGLDILKKMYRLILRLDAKELWFEEMPD